MPLFKRVRRTGYQKAVERTAVHIKLGISSDAPREKIIFELNKLKHKDNLRRILKLTDANFKQYGIA